VRDGRARVISIKYAPRVLISLVMLSVLGAGHLDIDSDDDDGGCELGLPMCRGIGSGAGDPVWTQE
jgi:hypothetical protein